MLYNWIKRMISPRKLKKENPALSELRTNGTGKHESSGLFTSTIETQHNYHR